MTGLAEANILSRAESAVDHLRQYLDQRHTKRQPAEDFEQFERQLHEYFVAAEREVLAEELARWDIDLPKLEIDGQPYRRVLRCETTYLSAVGPVRVERSLYGTGQSGERALCPLECGAGVIEGFWTPRAAKQAGWVVAHLTPQEAEALFKQLGNMQPSRSSLDRLPKALSGRWEVERERFEAVLRGQSVVPEQATTVAVSLDGVLVPMRDGERQRKRAQAVAAGKQPRGPAGYQEVGCGTVSFYDAEGQRLSTLRLARMPEPKKPTLKAILTAELETVLEQRPELTVVKLADGAKDNWTYLSKALPKGMEMVDFYHAAEHLKTVFDSAYGEHSPAATAQFEKYRRLLRDDAEGVTKVIRALAYLKKKHPRRKKLATELKYFRRHRHRMHYATAQAEHLPIGSGVGEAACKTLATQRLKRSGMRWRQAGGQAILTLRALVQSERFEAGWELLAETYKQPVSMPHNVVPFLRDST